jgi:hypothetical protein
VLGSSAIQRVTNFKLRQRPRLGRNHVYAFALHTMYLYFVKISGAHRMTPAQAAGVDSRLWEIGDIVKVVEDWEAGAISGSESKNVSV